jgi:hypothetical protein
MKKNPKLATAILSFLTTSEKYKHLPEVTDYLSRENILTYDWAKEGELRAKNLLVSRTLQSLRRSGKVAWDKQSGWYLVEDLRRQTNSKIINTLETIIADMENDAVVFQGRSFNGATVGEYLGNLGAAVAALAEIMKTQLKEPPCPK